MNKQNKIFYLITVLDFLLLILLTFISLRFLVNKWQKAQAVNPEILAQYNITPEVDKFLQSVKKSKKNNP